MEMKSIGSIIGIALIACSCNNEPKSDGSGNVSTDSTSMSTTTTENNAASGNSADMQPADQGSSDFLIKAADGGMAEVMAGEQAQAKATHPDVKMFAGMMVNDHTGANANVKALAGKLQVGLPAEPSADHKNMIMDVNRKSGSSFDKAYMKMMVDDHEKTINLFKKSEGEVANQEVKTFISNTLPKLQMHLDSAKAIQKRL